MTVPKRFHVLFRHNVLVFRIQRQSRGIRETSSGYDSSDNETSTNYKYSRKYRSDPDFRMQNLHPSYQVNYVTFCQGQFEVVTEILRFESTY